MMILVTGGAGFIGSNTVDLLLERGHHVRVLDNFYSGKKQNLQQHPHLQVMDGDIRDARIVLAAMEGVTHVLHLAAQVFVPTSIEQPAFSGSVNIGGFVNVLDAARQAKVQRFVYASSAAVYGIPVEFPLTEQSPPMALSPYALEKLVNDQYAQLFLELYGTSTCGLRYFNVYGPRQDPRSPYSGVISKFCERAHAGQSLQILGDGLQTRDFISVYDVARANLVALEHKTTGVVNVATGKSVTLLQLVKTLGEVLGKALPVTHGPARVGEVKLSSVIPKRLQEELGIQQCRQLDQGLRTLLASLQQETA